MQPSKWHLKVREKRDTERANSQAREEKEKAGEREKRRDGSLSIGEGICHT